jgi:murein DD-endopeptidase MepM/ murein hydrolase activator NlpD
LHYGEIVFSPPAADIESAAELLRGLMNHLPEETSAPATEATQSLASVGAQRTGRWVPDLGADIGSKRWFLSLFVLIGLIAGASALGWYALQGPDAADLFQSADSSADINKAAAPDATAESQASEPDQSAAQTEAAAPAVTEPALKSVDLKIKRNSTLIEALLNAGINSRDAHNAVAALRKVDNLRKLASGQVVTVGLSEDEKPVLQKISYQPDVDRAVFAERGDDGQYKSWTNDIALTKFETASSGTIDDSLFLSAQRSGVPTGVIVDLIRIFSWDVDFQREIREGDKFEVFFERYRDNDGNVVKDGDVLYAALTLSGTKIQLYRYQPEGEKFAEYFKPDGRSAKKMLMRTPIDGAHLTSTFGMRKHPILGYTRMHKGVDFGAPRGTPIMASGDGVVERASRFGGYGKYIRIRHNSTYSTAYGHMNAYAKGIHPGLRVHQGQIIGYVGSTGEATGPHLHYEVLVSDKQVNPLSLKLPTGYNLEGQKLADFKAMVKREDVQIADAENIKLSQTTDGVGHGATSGASSAPAPKPRSE